MMCKIVYEEITVLSPTALYAPGDVFCGVLSGCRSLGLTANVATQTQGRFGPIPEETNSKRSTPLFGIYLQTRMIRLRFRRNLLGASSAMWR